MLKAKPEGRPSLWLPTKESLVAFIEGKKMDEIHCFLPGGAIFFGADWATADVLKEIANPDAAVCVFTDPSINLGHSLALTTSEPPDLKLFDIGPITLADIEPIE